MECIKFPQALDENLQVIKPQIRQTFRVVFEGMTESEQICYILCNVCGWDYNTVAKHLKITDKTIKARSLLAARKRKSIPSIKKLLSKQLQRFMTKK